MNFKIIKKQKIINNIPMDLDQELEKDKKSKIFNKMKNKVSTHINHSFILTNLKISSLPAFSRKTTLSRTQMTPSPLPKKWTINHPKPLTTSRLRRKIFLTKNTRSSVPDLF